MVTKKTKTTPKSGEVRIKRSEDFLSIYSNNAQLQMSSFDARMIFGEASLDDEGTLIQQKVSVVMSLEHLKVFTKILTDHVQKYEAQVGEIKLPPKEEVAVRRA